jgi:hypothetical protein
MGWVGLLIRGKLFWVGFHPINRPYGDDLLLEPDKKAPSRFLCHMSFIVGLVEGEVLHHGIRALEFKPRSHIFQCT